MIQSLTNNELARYVAGQINNLFPDANVQAAAMLSFVNKAIERTNYCFSKINIKYFFDGQNVLFKHLNSDQYAIFLYYLSNSIWQMEKDANLAARVYYLNKALHGLEAFYEVSLPDVFVLIHPLGTVLGRAQYQNYFVAYQRVTVGGNSNNEYPVIGRDVVMYGGSALIGKCKIGNNCLISIGTIVMEKEIPPDMVVFGKHPDIQYKKTTKSVLERYFRQETGN